MSGEDIFTCVQCGKCCEGRGGIVLSDKDLDRLAAFFNCAAAEIIEKYTESSGGKLRLRAGEDGNCVFFDSISSCRVHAGKPDICRAWPFFRGNLLDPLSLEMARDFCPGINKGVSFQEFSRRGLAALEEEGLIASDASREAAALIIDKADFPA